MRDRVGWGVSGGEVGGWGGGSGDVGGRGVEGGGEEGWGGGVVGVLRYSLVSELQSSFPAPPLQRSMQHHA